MLHQLYNANWYEEDLRAKVQSQIEHRISVIWFYLEAKLMRHNPRYQLSFYLGLEVVTFDRYKYFTESFRVNDSLHELEHQPSAQRALISRNVTYRWKRTEKVAERQTVVQIPESVDKRRIPAIKQ